MLPEFLPPALRDMAAPVVAAEDYPYWLALSRVPGIGPVTFARLLARFVSPRAVLGAGRGELLEAGLKGEALDAARTPDWASVERDLHWLEQPGHYLLTLRDPDYPPRLRQIHDPPPILFVDGDPALLSAPQLAMIGSRNPSRDGEQTAVEFARHLSQMGLVITSGLAAGIDAASHRGALAGTGLTVAVAGTGLDLVYPAKHRDLARQIAGRGALVSEFPTGTPPRNLHFPRRNRIISGLSLGVLVVEATLRSGSLITARLAGEQGREVFAIPGSIHNPLVKGCHALLKDGAKLVESASDIIEELSAFAPGIQAGAPPSDVESAGAGGEELDADYTLLLNNMAVGEPLSIDTLVERCGLTPEAVSSMLLILELRGLVAASGGHYTRLGQRIE